MFRRAFLTGAAASTVYCIPPVRRVLADTNTSGADVRHDIRKQFTELNDRDSKVLYEKTVNEIIKWEAVKDDKAFIEFVKQGRMTQHTLEELMYMTSFYTKPLNIAQKMIARNKLLRLYEQTPLEEEKQYLVNIMKYFDLFD